MFKRYLYISLLCIAMLDTFMVAGQPAMPDTVCMGQTRHYNVDPNPVPGSTYTWWIAGIVQSGFTTNEFIHTWNTSNTYLLEVQEFSANGCFGPKRSGQVFVNPSPSIPTVILTQPTCVTATGTITVTSATSGLTFSLDGAAFVIYPAGGFTPVASGIHTLTAKNAGNCISAVTNIIVNAQPILKNNYTIEISDYNGFNISCHGQSDGSIRITPSDPSSQLTFSWSGPGGFTGSAGNISGLKAGQYTVSITDKNMCISTETFKLTEPQRLSMTFDPSLSTAGGFSINCAGAKTGSVTVSVHNNVATARYLWADGFIGNTRANLTAGIYKIIITDSNNCHADSTVTITEPDSLKLTFDITEPYCSEKPDGKIRLSVTGGVSGNDYIYLWSDNSTGRNISNAFPGLYKVAVSDLNGCIMRDSVQVMTQNEICLTVPEAISPNGDLINDVWNIDNIYLYPRIEVTIYNRWGQVVWRSEPGYPVPWDGRSNGFKLPLDSYHYTIDLHNGSNVIIGTITIDR